MRPRQAASPASLSGSGPGSSATSSTMRQNAYTAYIAARRSGGSTLMPRWNDVPERSTSRSTASRSGGAAPSAVMPPTAAHRAG